MKKHFLMLSLIIPGKHAVTGDTFDVYLQPLLEELHILWSEGVMTHDATRHGVTSVFRMRGILLWTIHDFPAYGIVVGCVTKGCKACPCCGPETESRRSAALSKNVYLGYQYRRFLPLDHPWRFLMIFNGEVELRPAPPVVTGEDVIRWGKIREAWIEDGATPTATDPARSYGIKRVSSLYQLPYWRVSFIIFIVHG